MEHLVRQQALAVIPVRGERPDEHRPATRRPPYRGVGDVLIGGQFSDIDTRRLGQPAGRLIGHDGASGWIDEQQRAVQLDAPQLPGVGIAQPLGLSEIGASMLQVDGRLLSRGQPGDEHREEGENAPCANEFV